MFKLEDLKEKNSNRPGRIEQSATCLTADPRVKFHPGPVPLFRGDHEIILQPFSLIRLAQEKSAVMWADSLNMTIAVD